MPQPHASNRPVPEPSAPNQFALLGTRRFLPLFVTQFLGAFNDQVFQKAFVALVTYRLADQAGIPIPMLGVIASGLFILPFAVVTPTAGQIADRMDKAVMMRWVKAWEIVVMGLAVIGYQTQSIWFLYFVLFLMGAQSAVFAPIKYSIIPQYLRRGELMGGNGILLEHNVGRYVADAEAIYSYEGTREVNTLIVGRAITGHGAIV